jgi:polyphenol oxidase
VRPDALTTMHQIHSARAVPVTGPLTIRPEADALVTATPGVLLAVLTADCQPVLFCDPEAKVIGAAHAGWRGAVDGVLEATLDAMEGLGAERSRITAVIGPTISQAAYEVGPEFFDRFRAEDTESMRFFASGAGDRMLFDLPGYGLHRLRLAGVGHAEWTGHCTYRDPARFYSYRRTTHAGEADYGRLISTIRL